MSRGHDNWIYQVFVDTCGDPPPHKNVSMWTDSYWTHEKCAWERLAELEANPVYENWEIQVDEVPIDLPLSRFNVTVCPRAHAVEQGWIGPDPMDVAYEAEEAEEPKESKEV